MKSLSVCAAAILFLASEVSAACVDDLRKIADTPLLSKEATNIAYKEQRSTDGGEFIVYFDKEDEEEYSSPKPVNKDSGARVLAFRAITFGESFRAFDRISFLNKNDFVIRAITEKYDFHYALPRGSEVLKVISADYLFCAGALQIPKEEQGGEKESAYRKSAEENRTFFFDASELAPYFKRITQ